MSFDEKNESHSQSTNYINYKNDNNNKLNTEQLVKKNKIINIRIYQNYSNNKNSNTFFDPYNNNFLYLNNSIKNTNEIGTQTETGIDKDKIDIEQKINNIKDKENFYRSLSHNKNGINKTSFYSENIDINNTDECEKKNKNIYQYKKRINISTSKSKSSNKRIKNINYNFNLNKNRASRKKENQVSKNYKSKDNKKELDEMLNNNKKKDKLKEYISNKIMKDEKRNISTKKSVKDDKNQIAKKYFLFNLKNDNTYTIINDGYYNSKYKENNKISINNIYLEGKSEKNNNKFIKRYNPIYSENHLNDLQDINRNNCYCKTSINHDTKNNKNIQNNSKFNLDENRKFFNKSNNKIGLISPVAKKLKKFDELSVVNCFKISINSPKIKRKEKINLNEYTNFKNDSYRNKDIGNNDYYKRFINFNKSLFECSPNNNEKKEIKDNFKESSNPKIKKINNQLTENIPIKIEKKNKINNKNENENIENKQIKKELKTHKNKGNNIKTLTYKDDKKLKGSKKLLIENKKINKKYDSFLQDFTKEEENDILFEDLLKTYSEESDKENKIKENNNDLIGDEKTFFNISKIPKIEEFKFVKSNNNIIINENKTPRQSTPVIINNKPNLQNILDKIHNKIGTNKIDYSNEYKLLNKITYKRNTKIFYNNEYNNKLEKEKKLLKNNKQYKSNLDEEYQKIINKKKMYNFLFNEKDNSIPYNKELKFGIKVKDNNGINNIINRLNTEVKSFSSLKYYDGNQNSTKLNSYKNNKRNKSCKNSYSKYYLNKLEIENKYLIPQLTKKYSDYFY